MDQSTKELQCLQTQHSLRGEPFGFINTLFQNRDQQDEKIYMNSFGKERNEK